MGLCSNINYYFWKSALFNHSLESSISYKSWSPSRGCLSCCVGVRSRCPCPGARHFRWGRGAAWVGHGLSCPVPAGSVQFQPAQGWANPRSRDGRCEAGTEDRAGRSLLASASHQPALFDGNNFVFPKSSLFCLWQWLIQGLPVFFLSWPKSFSTLFSPSSRWRGLESTLGGSRPRPTHHQHPPLICFTVSYMETCVLKLAVSYWVLNSSTETSVDKNPLSSLSSWSSAI